jgi:hypothetical protein
MTQVLSVTKAKERRRKSSFLLKASDSLTVRMRKLDVPSMILMGLIPLPMLQAAGKFEEMQGKISENSTAMEVLEVIDPEDQKKFVEFLRQFACEVVLEPTIVLEDDGIEDHLPVTELDINELMAIWNAGPTKEDPIVSTASAEEFHRAEPDAHAHDVPRGEDVRAEAKLMAGADRDFITA